MILEPCVARAHREEDWLGLGKHPITSLLIIERPEGCTKSRILSQEPAFGTICSMSEIKYEIIKKIGVLSSPLRPSPYEDLRRTLTAPTPLHFGDASASLRVRCPPNQNPIWGKPGFESFLQNGLCGWRAIIGIKSLPILGRLEGQGLNREPK
jgi:hypothetical protein